MKTGGLYRRPERSYGGLNMLQAKMILGSKELCPLQRMPDWVKEHGRQLRLGSHEFLSWYLLWKQCQKKIKCQHRNCGMEYKTHFKQYHITHNHLTNTQSVMGTVIFSKACISQATEIYSKEDVYKHCTVHISLLPILYFLLENQLSIVMKLEKGHYLI